MEKLDLKSKYKHLYQPSAKEPAFVDVPDMNFLMVDGEGDPNSSAVYAAAIEALYAAAYTIKFTVKKGPLGIDYPVMALEGLWWADDMSSFVSGDKGSWKWTMMIMQPEFVHAAMVRDTVAEVGKKKALPAIAQLRFGKFAEGKSAQILHVGPFSAEGPTIARVHAFIASLGGKLSGKHHEIYLSDIRKADPAKWKTVIRQPLK